MASAIMKYILDSIHYDVYVLEFAYTNTKAVKLYEKLGYSELLCTKQKHSKQSGVNNLVYMKYL